MSSRVSRFRVDPAGPRESRRHHRGIVHNFEMPDADATSPIEDVARRERKIKHERLNWMSFHNVKQYDTIRNGYALRISRGDSFSPFQRRIRDSCQL